MNPLASRVFTSTNLCMTIMTTKWKSLWTYFRIKYLNNQIMAKSKNKNLKTWTLLILENYKISYKDWIIFFFFFHTNTSMVTIRNYECSNINKFMSKLSHKHLRNALRLCKVTQLVYKINSKTGKNQLMTKCFHDIAVMNLVISIGQMLQNQENLSHISNRNLLNMLVKVNCCYINWDWF